MLDFYLDKQTLEELILKKEYRRIIDYIVEEYDTGAYDKDLFPILENSLITNNEFYLFKRFWNHIINTRINRFWHHYKHYNNSNHNKSPRGFMKFLRKKEQVIDEDKITTEELLDVNKVLVEANHIKYPKKTGQVMKVYFFYTRKRVTNHK